MMGYEDVLNICICVIINDSGNKGGAFPRVNCRVYAMKCTHSGVVLYAVVKCFTPFRQGLTGTSVCQKQGFACCYGGFHIEPVIRKKRDLAS